MSDADLNLILRAKDLASKPVEQLDKKLKDTGESGQKAAGPLANLGSVGLVAAGGLLAVAGGLGLLAEKGAEQQASMARLQTSLRDNITGFNGNTDAIEALISKREELGFSDSALRDSLTFLVTKYKNVEQAEQVQAVAMDIARQKNISLEEATLLVSKGMDGNAKVLKQLGIELPKTATAQQRLTAIQKESAGQAEAYGKTAAGAQARFSVAIDRLTEDLGSALLPVLTTVANFLTDTAIPAIRGVVTWIQGIIDAVSRNQAAMAVLRGAWEGVITIFKTVADILGNIIGLAGHVIDILGSIKLPDLSGIGNIIPHFAQGGVVQPVTGGSLAILGEGGEREYVIPESKMNAAASGGGFTIRGVSQQELVDMVDRGLYFQLQRAAPTLGRT